MKRIEAIARLREWADALEGVDDDAVELVPYLYVHHSAAENVEIWGAALEAVDLTGDCESLWLCNADHSIVIYTPADYTPTSDLLAGHAVQFAAIGGPS